MVDGAVGSYGDSWVAEGGVVWTADESEAGPSGDSGECAGGSSLDSAGVDASAWASGG